MESTGNRAKARAYLVAACAERGSQSALAGKVGVRVSNLNPVVRGHNLPSKRLAAALEREVGIPADWWFVPTLADAQDALGELVLMEPHPGWVAAQLKVRPEDVGRLTRGEVRPDEELAELIGKLTKVPWPVG